MGGIGSGQYPRKPAKTNTEQSKRIDVRYLHQHGLLNPGSTGKLLWNIRGQPSGDINYRTQLDHLEIDYLYRAAGGLQWEPITQIIRFSRTPCHFGGERAWFLCPDCNQRIAVLYGNGRLFLCRHCHQLPYESQQLCNTARLIEQKHKLGRRVFAHYEYGEGYGKPKGMHSRTFNLLLERYSELEQAIQNQMSNIYTVK